MAKAVDAHLLASPRLSLVCIATLILASSGCTRKSEVGTVNIQLPKSYSANSNFAAPGNLRSISSPTLGSIETLAGDDPNWNTSLNPTTGSEINCFAVFVGGPGLTGNKCAVNDNSTSRTIEFGPNKGFLPGGSVVQMDVPSGADRVFHVVGLRSSSASACGNYQNTQIDSANLSEPFLIASQRANIPSGESSLAIVGALDINKKITSCDFMDDGGGSGSTDPNLRVTFGDNHDGTINYSEPAGTAYLDSDVDPLNLGVSGYTFSPYSGGALGTKYGTATRRVINVVTSGATSGRELTLATAYSAQEFEVGDEVLWYVSNGRANPGPPDDPVSGACGGDLYLGRYGFARIASLPTSTTITLDSSITSTPTQIKNSNLTSSTASTDFCRISVTRVMNFNGITVGSSSILNIYPPIFNAEEGTGGVLAIRAREATINGSLVLNTMGYGYRGAATSAVTGGSVFGLGTPNGMPNGNGGGTATSVYSGGGGGGAGEGGTGNTSSAAGFGGQPLSHDNNRPYVAIAPAPTHVCGLSTEGKAYCWGSGVDGELGAGLDSLSNSFKKRLTPHPVNTTLTFKQISTGSSASCGIASDDRVYCWGLGLNGTVGHGSYTSAYSPVAIADTSAYLKVAVSNANGNHACGVLSSTRRIRCWGLNSFGQLGNGTTTTSNSPVDVQDIGVLYTDVYAGHMTTCGLTTTGTVYCWGANPYGQFGNNSTTNSSIPILAASSLQFKKLAVGEYFVCGIQTTDLISCWGDDTQGSLGNGAGGNSLVPVATTGGSTYRDITAGSGHVCATETSGVSRCWGLNSSGQLGDGTSINRAEPTVVTGGLTFSTIAAGSGTTCGIVSSTQKTYCWGNGLQGQLGSHGFTGSLSPLEMRNQSFQLALPSSKVFLGGGGGGGDNPAGSGGGFVYFMSREVRGTGTLSVNASGVQGFASGSRASGGGGGGVASVAVKRLTVTSTILNVSGGAGAAGSTDNSGGGGGGGLAELYSCAAESTSTSSLLIAGGTAPAFGSGATGLAINQNNSGLCAAP